MTKPEFNQDWVDRYVRDQLTDEEVESFESRLMDDPDLQDALETALALQRLQKLDLDEAPQPDRSSIPSGSTSSWQSFALAASLLVAVGSSVFLWRASNENALLNRQLQALNTPTTSVLTVPVDILRSPDSQVPVVIRQIPLK